MALSSVGLALPASSGCSTVCNLGPACDGGLHWVGRRASGEHLELGTYDLEVTLESDRYRVSCEVASGECTPAMFVEGDDRWVLAVVVVDATTDGGSGAGPGSLELTAASHDGDDVRGPESAAVIVSMDATTLVDETYQIAYERDPEFWGDPDCGACDSRESRAAEWD